MNWIHPDIAGKRFVFECIDDGFTDFANEHCSGTCPERLLDELEETISLYHGEALPLRHDGAPTIWELETAHLQAHYMVYEHTIHVGSIASTRTNVAFESDDVRELLG
ncbi:MAG: hypothetical protein CMJ58_12435 [Planctomycetaceae bacterium]|nr:hypothetical protein [Planctomycetaceae bacterium]